MVAAVLVAAVVAWGAPRESPVEAAPPAERVTLFSDSVGLGTRGYFGGAFPADWDATVIGTPALFVGQLESKHVRPTLASAPHLIGDQVLPGSRPTEFDVSNRVSLHGQFKRWHRILRCRAAWDHR